MLNFRRESVTDDAGNLQTLGVIRYHRGRTKVLDRPTLNVCLASVTPWSREKQIACLRIP